MPKIVEYDATIAQDKITPSNTGYSATEMAARRIGSFAEQEAAGTKEVGALQNQYDREVGQQLTDFLRFKGLEDKSVGVKVSGGGGGNTLIGTGSNRGITYNQLQEAHGGPAYLSHVARQAVSRTNNAQSQEQQYWDRVNQKDANNLDKDTGLGGDPLKEMNDITRYANDQSLVDKANQSPDYMGPGANFYDANGQVVGQNSAPSYSPASSSNQEVPANPPPSTGLWSDITTGQSDNSTDQSQGPF